MAIPVPVTRTKIATVPWGIPITNEVNRLTAAAIPTPWTALTLQSGWTNAPNEQPAQIRAIGDMVYIRGRVGGGGAGTTIFNCPAEFRPPKPMAIAASNYGTNAILSPSPSWYWCLNDFRADGNYVFAGLGGAAFCVIDSYWSKTA